MKDVWGVSLRILFFSNVVELKIVLVVVEKV